MTRLTVRDFDGDKRLLVGIVVAIATGTNEIDYALSCEGTWRKATVKPSLQLFTYPKQEDAPSVREAVMKITYPAGRISLFTTQSLHLLEYQGACYGDVGLCYEKELSPHTQFESSLTLGWASSRFNEAYIGPHRAALNLGALDISVTHTKPNGTYIRSHLSFSTILDGTLRDAVNDPFTANIGLAAGMEF